MRGAVGCRVWGQSQALTAERVWNAIARLLHSAWRAAKELACTSPTERASKTIRQDFIFWLVQHCSVLDAHDYHNINSLLYYHRKQEKKKSCEMSCAENNNCFLTFLRDFVMLRGFYTSSFLRSVDTVRADWNLMLLLTSASPAVIVPLFIITAAEDEKGWVAQTPCLPSLNRAQHTALICSDTAAQILLLLLLD